MNTMVQMSDEVIFTNLLSRKQEIQSSIRHLSIALPLMFREITPFALCKGRKTAETVLSVAIYCVAMYFWTAPFGTHPKKRKQVLSTPFVGENLRMFK